MIVHATKRFAAFPKRKSISGVSCAAARQGQRRIIAYSGKLLQIFRKYLSALPSPPRLSPIFILSAHAPEALQNTWRRSDYLQGVTTRYGEEGNAKFVSLR